jgi:predicted transcriptional regulator
MPVQLQLEPRPTKQLNLKAEPKLIDAVDQVANRLGTTRSAIARALIRQGISALEQQEG